MTDPIKILVEGRHPKYAAKLPHWLFLESTYEGGREWFKDNLFKYVKEGDKEYASRLARAYRFNHTKQVVDTIDKYLFKMKIARKVDDAPDELKLFWSNATLSGLDIDTFAKRISQATSKVGRVYIVVDSNVQSSKGAVLSKADEKASAGQIYAYIVMPSDMLDMSYDEMGQLNWALVREFARDDADPLASSRAAVERFRLWTRESWTLYEKVMKRGKVTFVEKDSGTHDLGIVPIVAADHNFTEELYEAPGLIDDIAYLDRANANYLSNLDAIIQDQAFSQMAMPAQGLMPGEDGYDKLMEMGTKRVFLYNGEAGAVPFYLSPDPKQAGMILGAIGKIINEIYHSVGLAAERTKEDNGGGIDNASGVAKAYDFERVNSLLAAKATALEMTEKRIARLVCLYGGHELPLDKADALVSYPLEFDTRSVYDEFEIAARLMLLSAPDEVRREQMRSLMKRLFPAASSKNVELLEKSLKDWPPEVMNSGLTDDTPGAPGSGKQSSGSAVKAANTQRVAKELAS